MPELIFIEGVSGVGKSTTVQILSNELARLGYSVKKYVEFDYTNPLDFYCTAYFTQGKYNELCAANESLIDVIRTNTIAAGDVRLVRYYNEDTPLFDEPLLSELSLNEFCYNPRQPVSIEEYTRVYKEVWRNWACKLDEAYDFIIFDGSLLHHPINDMMRNYGIHGEQAVLHITTLLNSLGKVKRRIFYIKTNDIAKQLTRAHIDRKQRVPTDEQIKFWENRYKNDLIVLRSIQEEYQMYDVSDGNWDSIKERILDNLIRI